MKVWEKIGLSILLLFLVLLSFVFVLPLGLEKVIIPYWTRRYSKSSTINISYDSVKVQLFSTYPYFQIRFDSLTLTGKGEFWQDTLFTCKSIVFLFKLKDLESAKNGLHGIEADLYGPKFNLLVDSSGRANYDVSFSSSADSTTEYLITFDKVYLNDASFIYLDNESDILTYSPKIQAYLSNFQFSSSRAIFNTSLFVKDFYFKIGKIWLIRNITFSIDDGYYANIFPFGRDDYFFYGNITINQSLRLNFNGVFKNWNFLASKPYYDYSLKIQNLSTDFKDFVSALPYFYRDTSLNFNASGDYFFKFKYIDKYFYSHGQKVDTSYTRADFSIVNGRLHIASFRDTLYNINLHGRIVKTSKTNVFLDYASFFLVKNYFYLKSFHINHRNNRLYLKGLAYSRFNLDEIKNFMPLNYKISGLLQLNLKLNGFLNYNKLSDLSNLNFTGDLAIKNFTLQKKFRLISKQILAQFNSQNIHLLANNFSINKLNFNSLELIADNYLPYIVARFDPQLTPQKLNLKLSASAQQIDLTQLQTPAKSANTTSSLPLPQIPANISLKLNLSINQLKTKYLTLHRNVLFAQTQNNSIKLIYNALIYKQTNLYLWLILNHKSQIKAKYYLELNQLPLRNLAKLPGFNTEIQPILRQTSGQISVKLNGTAELLNPNNIKLWRFDINGKLTSSKIALPPQKSKTFLRLAKLLKINDLQNPILSGIDFDFKINNQQIKLLPSNFLMNNLKSQIHGFYDFQSGLMSAKLKLYLPPSLALQTLHKVVSGQKDLAVIVRIYGNIYNPKLSLGSNLLKKDIKTYTPQTINMTFKQDSILAQSHVRADSIIKQAKLKAQKIIDSARTEQLKIYRQAEQQIQSLRQSGKYTKHRAKKIIRKARRRARKIMRQALKKHDKILRQAYRLANSLKHSANQQNRKIQRSIKQQIKPKRKKHKLHRKIKLLKLKKHKPQ